MAGVPFKVKAVYEYTSQESDDLNFPLGQVITVTEEIDADWYEGEYTDVNGVRKSGIFPNNFVEKYEPEIPSRPSRPSRPAKEDQAQVPSTVTSPPTNTNEEDAGSKSVTGDTQAAPPVPALSKPPPAAESAPQPPPERQLEPVTSPKPEPVQAPPTESKKPPPVAPKTNAFKDRIAAFNQPAAAPVLPFQPQRNQPPAGFIKKPFVAPPPSKDAYVPAPKQEAVIRPYHREEDPEIRQRQEEDQAAAQAAGLTNEGAEAEEAEDAPKPQSLKDRIAMLQKQQAEQALRRAEGVPKKEKKAVPPPKKPSQSSQAEADNEEVDVEPDDERVQRFRSSEDVAETADDRGQQRTPRLPSAQRRAAAPVTNAPPVPQHEILSGGEEADQSAADETTDDAGTIGADDVDSPAKPRPQPQTTSELAQGAELEDEEAEEEEDEDDELDEETRRRLELRERMAKMSGGMGMPGMFGPPGMMPSSGALPPKKRTSTKEKRSTEDSLPSSPPLPQQRVPMVPVPGIARVTSPDPVEEDASPDRTQTFEAPRRSLTGDRVPLHAGEQSRPIVPSIPTSTSAPGYESDDDEPPQDTTTPADTPHAETPVPPRPAAPPVPKSGPADTSSYFSTASADSSAAQENSITSPRPPPPPPPTATGQAPPPVPRVNDERGESEYEGDYDTDIGSSAKRKDALKSHGREPSYDDSTTADETSLKSPGIPEYSRPPPPPPQASRPARPSADLPRAPPPMPPPREAQPSAIDDDEYDPYKYTNLPKSPPPVPDATPANLPPIPPPRDVQESAEDSSDDLYSGPTPARKSTERQLPPPPPPPDNSASLPVPPRAPPRQSLDLPSAGVSGRRSIEQSRVSGEHGQIASDIDLSESTQWWTEADPLPPALQDRRGLDILSESEESTTSKRGGRTTVSKDIYILYLDYSQTIITARYDAREPADVSLEQRHEPPPPKLRQDQLESVWSRFGAKLAQTVDAFGSSKKDAAVGDGSSVGLVYELIKAIPEALLPVGTRAYGALVYANLANASVMQYDEIRAGDIVTLRNAKLEGKHSGGLHQKYKQETGALHVAIVHEWDGTKKKIRAWEQGREKKGGLRSESYRLGDLKSGEVRVWRVVGRDWVGWDGNS